jgi:hypothetical protein
MPRLHLAGALLEAIRMNSRAIPSPTEETMINAREAAAALGLPYYWFVTPAMRTKHRIPHYHFGSSVRFRLSQLMSWATHYPAAEAGSEEGGR